MTRLYELKQELTRSTPKGAARATDPQALIQEARRLRSQSLARLINNSLRPLAQAIRGSGVGAALRALSAPEMIRAFRRRQTIVELNKLSDRMLADIGLTRDQIKAVAAVAAETASRNTPRRTGSVAKRLFAAMRRAQLRRATIRELEQLPGYVLADIGIAHGQIPAAVDNILARQSAQATVSAAHDSPVHMMLRHLETVVRPLRQWQVSRLTAGQIARLDSATLADLGYVKGDVDWVPEVMAERRIANSDTRPQAGAA